jgi:signal transduction histidine kinase
MKWGLNVKFICYTVFIVVFISLVFSVVFIYQSRKALEHDFNKRAQSLVKNLALNIEVPLFIENESALTSLSQNLLKEKDVQSVRIFDQKDRVLVSMDKGRKLLPWQKKKFFSPVYFSPETGEGITEDMSLFFRESKKAEDEDAFQPGQVIGKIEVVFSRESIIRTLNRIRWWIFIAATVAAVIGGIGGLYFSRTLILPIQRLARATYSIARGNWEERLEVLRTDELGQLTESFNIMAKSLIAKKQQLESTYKELAQKEKMAEIGKVSMIIAHELKNPLGIIKGSVDIIDKRTTEPQVKETMIRYIQDEVKRLNKLIDDFLSFTKPMPPRKILSDVNSLVKKFSEHFTVPEEENKNISLRIDLGSPHRIEMDENQIYQALLNLINNSVQAIQKKGEIHIKTDCNERWVRMQVSDTGAGIPEELKEKIFEPFFTTKAKGTGLGLAIVKKFVENHQGYIEISDFSGGGTTFNIFLPVSES